MNYSNKGKIQVSMIPYLNNLLKEFPEVLGAPAANTVPDHLFKVIPKVEAILLPEEQAQVLHHTVV